MSVVFKNEIQWLSQTILPEILRNGRLLDDYSADLAHTFQVKSIDISIIGPEEAYMLTICYRATVIFEYAGQQQQRKLIIKRTPKISPDLYDNIQFGDLFSNEVRFYTEILPIIQELSNGTFSAPKYYYSEVNPQSAVLILGDFGADGWSVTRDRYGLSLEHAQIAVKYLGRFHGFGYAIKHNQAERFKDICSKLKESRFNKSRLNPEWDLKQRVTVQRATNAVIKYYPDFDKGFLTKYQQLTSNYMAFGRQRVMPREPYATLCHGDYLRNNVAYKYDTDTSGKPLDIMMFDYQTMRLCSPMIDLAVFFCVSLVAEVRSKHFDSLFDDYCNALCESYATLSQQPVPEFLNRQDLLRELIRFMPYATFIATFFLMELVEPPTILMEEHFNKELDLEMVAKRASVQGGETVNRELAHQLKELFELCRQHNMQIDEDINVKDYLK